jgi:putative restriction endonuclease
VLEDEDGPLLQHGLKGLHGAQILLPNAFTQWPSRDALAWRFDRFTNATSHSRR